MRSPRSRSPRARIVAAALAGGLVLAACGSDDGSDSDDTGDDSAAAAETPAPPDEADVAPEADAATNQLPDVVVDDLIAGNQVNVRNLAPSDRPILLWMWAPH